MKGRRLEARQALGNQTRTYLTRADSVILRRATEGFESLRVRSLVTRTPLLRLRVLFTYKPTRLDRFAHRGAARILAWGITRWPVRRLCTIEPIPVLWVPVLLPVILKIDRILPRFSSCQDAKQRRTAAPRRSSRFEERTSRSRRWPERRWRGWPGKRISPCFRGTIALLPPSCFGNCSRSGVPSISSLLREDCIPENEAGHSLPRSPIRCRASASSYRVSRYLTV